MYPYTCTPHVHVQCNSHPIGCTVSVQSIHMKVSHISIPLLYFCTLYSVLVCTCTYLCLFFGIRSGVGSKLEGENTCVSDTCTGDVHVHVQVHANLRH